MAGKTKSPSTLRTLQSAAKGLLYISEQDKPIKAFAWSSEDTKGATTAEDAIAAITGADKSKLKGLSLAEFFAPITKEEAWHGEEERAAVAKAKSLAQTLNQTLTGARVYRIEGDTNIPVYVIGRDANGNWAGVQTTLVET